MNFFEFLWQNPIFILFLYLSIITLVGFVIMGVDKSLAKKQKSRIPESTLFLICIIGGSLGGLIGMYVFHHKTLHKSFSIGVPLILVLQIALAVLINIVATP